MHISDKLAQAWRDHPGDATFSFEYFPPKTAQGLRNLYGRIERMRELGPAFADVTWGAGGSTTDRTTELIDYVQKTGLESCMHMTCTSMRREKIDLALERAREAGCQNILALRGDPPRESEDGESPGGEFQHAIDLVRHIKRRYGDYFDIGVAGYSEGCDNDEDPDLAIQRLKEKVDAGGTFIISQMFYDADYFLEWVRKCRAIGINVPIIPGIMPIDTYDNYVRRTNWIGCRIPPEWHRELEGAKHDENQVKEVGLRLVSNMCRRLEKEGDIKHFHL